MKTLSDNPGATTGVIGTFVATTIGLLISFGVHVTDQQAAAILLFVAALYGLLTWVLHLTTVAKTPSSLLAPLQAPPPGTSLVMNESVGKAAPIPNSDIIVTTLASPPQ